MSDSSGRSLPGFRKRSFAMPFSGGEIWFEHLDGLYTHTDLALEKLAADTPVFRRPSLPSLMAVILNETQPTPVLLETLAATLRDPKKVLTRIAVIGLGKPAFRQLRRELSGSPFALRAFDDLEKAKEWLVSEDT